MDFSHDTGESRILISYLSTRSAGSYVAFAFLV